MSIFLVVGVWFLLSLQLLQLWYLFKSRVTLSAKLVVCIILISKKKKKFKYLTRKSTYFTHLLLGCGSGDTYTRATAIISRFSANHLRFIWDFYVDYSQYPKSRLSPEMVTSTLWSSFCLFFFKHVKFPFLSSYNIVFKSPKIEILLLFSSSSSSYLWWKAHSKSTGGKSSKYIKFNSFFEPCSRSWWQWQSTNKHM